MPDLAYQTLGVLIALGGAALLYWSLLHDRARGRRRCPKCWYDLRAATTLTCPECGRTAKREGQLYKTRRRRGWAVVGVVLGLAAASTPIVIRGQRDGWAPLLPNTALIVMIPWFDSDWPIEELHARHYASRDSAGELKEWLWGWQSALLAGRVRAALTDLESPRDFAYADSALGLLYARDQMSARILMDLLDHPDEQVRYMAIDLLTGEPSNEELRTIRSFGEELIPKLIAMTRSEHLEAGIAVSSLAMFPDHAEQIVPLLRVFLQEANQPLAWEACWALPAFGSAAREAIPDLVAHLRPKDNTARIALATLQTLGDLPQSALDAIRAGVSNEQSDIRGDCLSALFEMGVSEEELRPLAEDLLADPRVDVRAAAIVTLCRMDVSADEMLSEVLPLLQDVEVAWRVAADLGRHSPLGEISVQVLIGVVERPCTLDEDWRATLVALASMREHPGSASLFTPVLINLWDENVDAGIKCLEERWNGPRQGRIVHPTPLEELPGVIAQTLGGFGPVTTAALPRLRGELERLKGGGLSWELRWTIQTIEGAIRSIAGGDQ